MKELFDQGYTEPIPSVEADSNRVFLSRIMESVINERERFV